MKKYLMIVFASVCSLSVLAQQEEKKEEDVKQGGFRKDLLFTGGNLNLFFGNVTVLGATPQLGYNVAQWLDAGISFGYTYSSQRDVFGNRYRQSLIAPGAFARMFPVDFLFASVHFEHNFVKTTELYTNGNRFSQKINAASLLLGLGYISGREGRNEPYYFVSISLDVLSNPNSPYRDVLFTQDVNNPNGYRVTINEPYPVIRAGFNIPLFQGSRRR